MLVWCKIKIKKMICEGASLILTLSISFAFSLAFSKTFRTGTRHCWNTPAAKDSKRALKDYHVKWTNIYMRITINTFKWIDPIREYAWKKNQVSTLPPTKLWRNPRIVRNLMALFFQFSHHISQDSCSFQLWKFKTFLTLLKPKLLKFKTHPYINVPQKT